MALTTAPVRPAETAPPPTMPNAAAGGTPKALPAHLQAVMSRVTEISSLPEITTRIVQVVEDPSATAHDMHEIVKNDPALAAKILKVVNSAFYGLPSQIGSLDHAILMLGMSAVKNIALAASLSRFFKAEPVSDQFATRDLWRHCIAVGVCARMLATAGKTAQGDEAFVAGLVHDMGLLIEQQLFPNELRVVADRCFKTPEDFCAVERQVIGADHEAFGAALATKWKFPPTLRYAISYHHDPASLKPEFRKIASLIYMADTICAQLQFGFWLTAQTQQISDEMLSCMGMTRAQLDEVTEQLPDQVEEAEKIFNEC